MSYSFNCPYLDMVHNGVIRCECGKIHLPDRLCRTEFMTKYCGHPTNYTECIFYKALNDYYKRIYSEEEAKW